MNNRSSAGKLRDLDNILTKERKAKMWKNFYKINAKYLVSVYYYYYFYLIYIYYLYQ